MEIGLHNQSIWYLNVQLVLKLQIKTAIDLEKRTKCGVADLIYGKTLQMNSTFHSSKAQLFNKDMSIKSQNRQTIANYYVAYLLNFSTYNRVQKVKDKAEIETLFK